MNAALKHLAEGALVRSGVERLARRTRRGRTLVLAYHNVLPNGEAGSGDKDLHLFAVRVSDNEVKLEECVCESYFPRRRDGTMIPEMDAYRWVTPADVDQYASRSLARLFQTTLSLAELHQTLA